MDFLLILINLVFLTTVLCNNNYYIHVCEICTELKFPKIQKENSWHIFVPNFMKIRSQIVVKIDRSGILSSAYMQENVSFFSDGI